MALGSRKLAIVFGGDFPEGNTKNARLKIIAQELKKHHWESTFYSADDLGGKVVIVALVDAADIHAGPQTHRTQRFQHPDRGGVIGVLLRGQQVRGHGTLDSCYTALSRY